jgi:hypothetical protein
MELSAKNFDEADEVVELPGLREEMVEVGGFVWVARRSPPVGAGPRTRSPTSAASGARPTTSVSPSRDAGGR